VTPELADQLAGGGTALAFILVVCLLRALARDFYRPWLVHRFRRKIAERRQDEAWVTFLRDINREEHPR
jgi:hypothetical protein